VVAGEMIEIGATKRKAENFTQEFKTQKYAEFIGYGIEKGHMPGAAFHRYAEFFSVRPSMEKPEPAMPSQATRDWITSQNIRRAKSHGKGARA